MIYHHFKIQCQMSPLLPLQKIQAQPLLTQLEHAALPENQAELPPPPINQQPIRLQNQLNPNQEIPPPLPNQPKLPPSEAMDSETHDIIRACVAVFMRKNYDDTNPLLIRFLFDNPKLHQTLL